jgi:CHAT domain-containing protein
MNWPKHLVTILAAMAIHLCCVSQRLSNAVILENLTSMDKNPALKDSEKLRLLYEWQKESAAGNLPQDSVYARLLHKIGSLEFYVNRNYNVAILSTLKARQINTAGKPGASTAWAATDLFNLAFFYDNMNLFSKALLYYDSAGGIARYTPDTDNVISDSRLYKAYVYFRMGDYDKAVEESDLGIAYALAKKDSLDYLQFLNQRAQSFFFQNKWRPALLDVQTAIPLAKTLRQPFGLASAYKTRAYIFARERNFPLAETSFKDCIAERIKSKDFGEVSGDYNDFGNFYSDSLKSYRQAAICFSTAIRYAKAKGDSTEMARVSLNSGRGYFYQQKLNAAKQCYLDAMRYLQISEGTDFLANPSAEKLTLIGNKELIQELFDCKTELLLSLYKQGHDPSWLTACLRTALLNDSLIAETRHEQLGAQSKLYWRDRTRGFFSDALEACYLASDANLAFYFMEKSRSVLLQDKLDELGASALLPANETAKLESLQISIIEWQQKISSFPDTSSQYKFLRAKLAEAKENLEQHIKSLEIRYPQYYQYKYADRVGSLSAMQDYLKRKDQRFIDYFIQDSTSFALCITPTTTRFIRIATGDQPIEGRLSGFLHFCSDENALNTRFPDFLANANSLYKILFSPFQLPGGRVIICQDNYLIPFEALSKDAGSPDFLLNNYSFSYVYSARYLMNQYENMTGKGDFLGIAPVNFEGRDRLPDLKRSENALRDCSAPYNRSTLLLYKDASRRNFMRQLSSYNTSTILTHAKADSSDNEPSLFMNDSVIHLSELQMLDKPATQLIVLSACQTNVGKNQQGEGIFSLARGFSAAGISSVAATQWEADEKAIYIISGKFNEYISRGMDKDEALQKAKLFYIQQDKRANMLPYYWADMILIGSAEPVQFSAGAKTNWGALAAALATVLGLVFFIRLGLRSRRHT